MANILAKAIRGQKKRLEIQTRLLGPGKGSKIYILKRDGTTKPFIILALLDAWGEDFSKFRVSKTFEFAVTPDQIFQPFTESRSFRHIASIATHLAIVLPDGVTNQMFEIRTGDDWIPSFYDWTYHFFAFEVSDNFVPANNAD